MVFIEILGYTLLYWFIIIVFIVFYTEKCEKYVNNVDNIDYELV